MIYRLYFSTASLFIFLYLLLLLGCGAAVIPALDYRTGAEIVTLSTNVSISVVKSDQGLSGNGILAFRRPDQLHLVILSPFGTTLMEMYLKGEQITVVYPGSSIGYVGKISDLPPNELIHGLRLFQWVLDVKPSDIKLFDGVIEKITFSDSTEKIKYKNGLVIFKKISTGEEVYYSDYSVISGVPLPNTFELLFENKERIRLVLDEPEVNSDLEDAVFNPLLNGINILPISELPAN